MKVCAKVVISFENKEDNANIIDIKKTKIVEEYFSKAFNCNTSTDQEYVNKIKLRSMYFFVNK